MFILNFGTKIALVYCKYKIMNTLTRFENFTLSFIVQIKDYERLQVGLRKLGYKPIITDISVDNIPEGCPLQNEVDNTDGKVVLFLIENLNLQSAAFVDTAITKIMASGS